MKKMSRLPEKAVSKAGYLRDKVSLAYTHDYEPRNTVQTDVSAISISTSHPKK